MLDHVIPLNEQHLRRLGREYHGLLSRRPHAYWIGEDDAGKAARGSTPESGAHRSGPASNRRSSSSVYLVTSGLGTTPLMSGRATLIEHLGSITVRLTMISAREPSRPGRNALDSFTVCPTTVQRTTMRSVESRSAISATEVGFDDQQALSALRFRAHGCRLGAH
jgi:hypothetical protein